MTIGALLTRVVTSVIPSASAVGRMNTENIVYLDTVADGLTAVASGTQVNSLLLTAKASKVTTVATNNDGVRLPPALPGATMTVRNNTAQTLGVFPSSAAQGGVSGGDAINALSQNALFSQPATGTVTYRCYTLGTWTTN